MEELHDHCTVCHNKHCDFDIVKGVSCRMTSCSNDCGQKLHECKQTDHDIICLNSKIACVNKQYGCPFEMSRHALSKHLGVCPANVVICMMEWNRWHRGSLQTCNDQRANTKKLKDVPVVHQGLDVALALHDQRVLLETIMPREVLHYYSELADIQSEERTMKDADTASSNMLQMENRSEFPIFKVTQKKEIATTQTGGHTGPLDNDDGRTCNAILPLDASTVVSHTELSPKECTTMANGDMYNCDHATETTAIDQLCIAPKGNDQASITDNLRKYVDVMKHKKEGCDDISNGSSGTSFFANQYVNGNTEQEDEKTAEHEKSDIATAGDHSMRFVKIFSHFLLFYV